MTQLCVLRLWVRLAVLSCLFQLRCGWTKAGELEVGKREADANQAPVAIPDAPAVTPKVVSRPMSVASRFRRVVKRASQDRKSTRTSDNKAVTVSETAASAAKAARPVGMGRRLGKRRRAVAGVVGATAGSVALLFFTGAALKRHILGGTPVPTFDSHLPGALSGGSVLLTDTPTPESYDSLPAFSYANQQSPRSLLSQVAFPPEDVSPTKISAPILLDGKDGLPSSWMSAGVAALLAVFSVAGVSWANRRVKRGGLLGGGLAAWDVDQCIMFVDVAGARKFKRLDGQFMKDSARIYLDATQTTGMLRYLEKPHALNNVVSRIIRRTLTRTELFPIPRERCFATVSIVSPSAKGATNKTTATEGPPHATQAEEKKAMIKSAFLREIVHSKTGTTAGILVHLERCPGWRRTRQQHYLLMEPDQFLHMLNPLRGLGGCPQINRMVETTATPGDADTSQAEIDGTPRRVVRSAYIESIIVDSRLQILACNMAVTENGRLQLYFILTASTPSVIKVHYALGSRQLLFGPHGPSSTDNSPCVTNTESGGLTFEENIPVYTVFPVNSLHIDLDAPNDADEQWTEALKGLAQTVDTKIFGIVMEVRQEGLAKPPKKLALRRADSVEVREEQDH